MKKINRLLKDAILFLMGTAAGLWYMQSIHFWWMWAVSASLLVLSDQFEIAIENGYINSLLRGQKSDK